MDSDYAQNALCLPSQKPVRRLPDFLIIGAAKSGTTSLFSYLERHPEIFLSAIKEPCFFSDDQVWGRGLDWYRSLFEQAQPHQICGEASTTYSRWPHTADAAARIMEVCPTAALVYVMRDPVERAYSHYGHHMRMKVTATFEELVERNPIYLDCSRYRTQIDRHRNQLSDRPIFLMTLEELKRSPEETLWRLQEFLGVKACNLACSGMIRANSGGSLPLANHRLSKLLATCGRLPLLSQVKGFVSPNLRRNAFHWLEQSAVGKFMTRDYALPPMQSQTRVRLLDKLESEIVGVEELMGRKLTEWRQPIGG